MFGIRKASLMLQPGLKSRHLDFIADRFRECVNKQQNKNELTPSRKLFFLIFILLCIFLISQPVNAF